ncbi:ArsR family transcriptional regulator [Fibrobacterota bacterium]
MIEGIFGNKTAEKVLLHLYHFGETHAAAVARDYKTAVTPIKNQLERFEKAGLLASRTAGRTRLYTWNRKSPFRKPVRKIVKIAYNSMPSGQRKAIFGKKSKK